MESLKSMAETSIEEIIKVLFDLSEELSTSARISSSVLYRYENSLSSALKVPFSNF